MKILYCATIRLPTEKAHGLQIMKTVSALAGSGADVELIIPNRKNPIDADPFEYYRVAKNFSINRLPVWDLITNNLFGLVGYWLQSYLFVHAVLRYYRTFHGSFFYLTAIPSGKKKNREKFCNIEERTPFVFYTRDLPLAYWLSKSTRPLFYEIHSLPPKPTWLHRRAWQRARGIVVISDGLKRELIRSGVAAEKIIVARDGVDVEQFQNVPAKSECRRTLRIPVDQKTVVYTGHLYGWKGADTLARAGKILESNTIHTYVVGGTDEEIDAFRKEFSSSTVHVVGRRHHEEIPAWLSAADLLVIPNSAKYKIGADYTSPLKAFEYMAAGRPIVASDVPALREILSDKAIFFSPDDPAALATAIKRGFENYQAWAHSARELVEGINVYSWEKRGVMIYTFICSRG